MKTNGLELKRIRSNVQKVVKITSVQDIVAQNFQTSATVAAYLDYKVLIGTFKDSRFCFYGDETFDDKYLHKLRVFNKDRELHLWRSNDGINGRLRIDGEGEEIDAVDACQVVFGTRSKELNGNYSRLTEDRGVELIIPLIGINLNEKKRVFLYTRNYIGYTPVGQAGYVDCRFVELTDRPLGRE